MPSFAMRIFAVLSLLGFLMSIHGEDDAGYTDMFLDVTEEVEDKALRIVGKLPEWLAGTMYQVGPARWSIGKQRFTHILDGFGKMHKFQFTGGENVKFSSKFIPSGMLNQSIEKGEIQWSILAQETEPPRHNPGPIGWAKSPMDNNNVNPWMFKEEQLAILSDTPALVNLNPQSLTLENEIGIMDFKNASKTLVAPITGGASAHPYCTEDGGYLGLREAPRMMPMGSSRMALYKLHPGNEKVMQDIAYVDMPRSSYAHSFGLTKGMEGGEHAIIVAQPIYENPSELLATGSLKKGFEIPSAGAKTMIHAVPMDTASGSKTISFEHSPFYFGHFANTFSSGPGKITFDIGSSAAIFFSRYSFDVQIDKSKRDNWADEHNGAYQTLTRFEIDIEAQEISSRPLFPDPKTQCAPGSRWCEFDLYKLHPDDELRPYCGFWAQQVYFNSSSFASQGLVRAELCGEVPRVAASWHRPNSYPGELQFVPKPGSTDKTEGVVIFHVYEGDTKLSKIMILDAKSMKELAYAVLPIRVPFTVHGNFYSAGARSHCMSKGRKVEGRTTFV